MTRTVVPLAALFRAINHSTMEYTRLRPPNASRLSKQSGWSLRSDHDRPAISGIRGESTGVHQLECRPHFPRTDRTTGRLA